MFITEYLRQYQNEKIFYYPNPGNAGDAVIAYATISLFRKLNLNFETITEKNIPDLGNQIVFYGGGGNFIPFYRDCYKFCEKFHEVAKKLIILPHTILDDNLLLSRFGKNVDIFCREQYTYRHVKQNVNHANVFLCDDLALNLTSEEINDLMNDQYELEINLPEQLLEEIKNFESLKLYHENLSSKSLLQTPLVLYCLRTDKERIELEIPNNNIDLSLKVPNFLPFILTHQSWLGFTAKEFFTFIQRYDVVITNRLHIAIMACLLNKTVKFYSNSYWKNLGVYEYSLAPRFSKIQWFQGKI